MTFMDSRVPVLVILGVVGLSLLDHGQHALARLGQTDWSIFAEDTEAVFAWLQQHPADGIIATSNPALVYLHRHAHHSTRGSVDRAVLKSRGVRYVVWVHLAGMRGIRRTRDWCTINRRVGSGAGVVSAWPPGSYFANPTFLSAALSSVFHVVDDGRGADCGRQDEVQRAGDDLLVVLHGLENQRGGQIGDWRQRAEAGNDVGQRQAILFGERAARARELRGHQHADADGFTVAEAPVLRDRFEGVPGGVAEIQDAA